MTPVHRRGAENAEIFVTSQFRLFERAALAAIRARCELIDQGEAGPASNPRIVRRRVPSSEKTHTDRDTPD